MFHFFEAIQNTKGDALIGYYVKAVDRDTGDVIDIYADNNATPIVSVSAVDNACLVDSDGDASFYVTAGTYHVDIYATDAVTFIRRVNDWPMTLDIDAVLSGTNTGDQTITLTGDVTGSGTGSFAATIGANKVTMAQFVAASGAGIVAASGAGNYAETAPAAARTILDVPSTSDMTAAIAAVGTGGGGADQPLSQVIAGLGIAWTGSLNFTMSAGSYYINGIVYTAAEQSITLSTADATNSRIDVLAVDTTGTLVKVNGTAAANPSQPDVDPGTQLFLKFVIVPAGATAPVISADEIVFEENDGVGEWTGATLSGTSVVFNSTSEPDSGTVCIAATSAGSAAAGIIRLNKGSTISVDTLDSLVIRFKSKTATWGTGQVRIHLQTSAGVRVGAILSLRNGSYGLTTSNTSTYQTLTIPITAFAIPAGSNLQYLQIADNTGAAISWRMDNIKLKKSSTATGGTSNGITQTQGDARYNQRANNLSDIVSASTARTNLGLGTVATLASDTDGTLAANSDTRVATQKAVRTYFTANSSPPGPTLGLVSMIAAGLLTI